MNGIHGKYESGMRLGMIRLTAVFLLLILIVQTSSASTSAFARQMPEVERSNYSYIRGDYRGIDRAAKSVFYVEIYQSDKTCIGSGSGFVMFDEGLFITNQHVIDGAAWLVIMDDDGQMYLLDQVVVSDKEHDIAILLFPDSGNYHPLDYDTDFEQLFRGQPVLTIGSPKGLVGTVSDGIISNFPKFKGEDTRYIQITAPISHGSSGGCLLNDELKVIGVTSSGVEEGENLGFAIPVFIVEQLYRQWNKKSSVTLGTRNSWDTVGAGLHKRVSGSAAKPQTSTNTSVKMTSAPTSVSTSAPTSAPVRRSASSTTSKPASTPTQKSGTMPLYPDTITGQKKIRTGDYITFGRYPQTATGNDSIPIEWLVLEVLENRVFLISRYGLDVKPYNTTDKSVTWETCTLRLWLNGEFLHKAFSESEQKAILTSNVDNSRSQGYWKTDGGRNTEDKVLLLSDAEANIYFGIKREYVNNMKSRVSPTEYAKQQGAQIDNDYKTEEGSAAGYWWLRSPGANQHGATYVYPDGSLGIRGVNYESAVVRPAMWVDLYVANNKNDDGTINAQKIDNQKKGKAGDQIVVGSYITFGRYPQSAAGNDSTPIKWLVLAREGQKVLLLSRDGLDAKPYSTDWRNLSWETCTLRMWLNKDFLNKAFSANEQQAILLTSVDNSKKEGYNGWNTIGENNTMDKVFLLSCAEAKKYLSVMENDGNNVQSRVSPTAYAVIQGAYKASSNKTAEGGAAGWWWLRSPGNGQYSAALVYADGSLNCFSAFSAYGAVRPAMWINLDAVSY